MADRGDQSTESPSAPTDDPDAVGLGNLPPAGSRQRRSPVAKIGGLVALLLAVGGLVWGLGTLFVESDRKAERRHAVHETGLMLFNITEVLTEGVFANPGARAAAARLPAIDASLTKAGFVDNGVNTPIEVVCALLRALPEGSLPPYAMRTGDTDGDGQPEYVDETGCPLVFVPRGAMERYAKDPPAYRRPDGSVFHPLPWVTHGRDRIEHQQVYALGPDGKPNTLDDVVHAH